MAAILQIIGSRVNRVQVRTDGASLLGPCIPAGDLIAIAGSPYYVRISGIGDRKAGFTSTHSVIPAGFLRIDRHAWATHVSVVLHVAVKVVGRSEERRVGKECRFRGSACC